MAATGTPSHVAPGSENLTERLRFAMSRLSNQQKILLMIAVAAIVALLVASNTWLKQADYRILFSNISERDGGSIIAAGVERVRSRALVEMIEQGGVAVGLVGAGRC